MLFGIALGALVIAIASGLASAEVWLARADLAQR